MLHKAEQKRKTAKAQYIQELASQPLHIREIAKRLGINWRTAYRMIHELKRDGWAIATTKDHLYYSVTLNDKIKNELS
jgi:DNA-binding IclR family transcriptional regulator